MCSDSWCPIFISQLHARHVRVSYKCTTYECDSRKPSSIFIGASGLAYIHYVSDVEIKLNSRRRVETISPRRSIRCQLDAISERCPLPTPLQPSPDNSPTVVGPYVFDNPLNIAAPRGGKSAGIKPMRIELFDFPPFRAETCARMQLRITMIAHWRGCNASRVSMIRTRASHTGYFYRNRLRS